MKRSEMITILAAKIDDIRKMELEDLDTFQECAANLLSFLEHEGFAPPEVAEPVKTSVMRVSPEGYFEQVVEDSKVFVRKWESEDGE
jgi:hypothetical protein